MADETVEGAEGQSKNALKKAQKAEEAAKKKAAKDEEKKAKKASEPERQTKVGGDEVEELDPTQYYENRIKAITNMEVRRAHNMTPETSISCISRLITCTTLPHSKRYIDKRRTLARPCTLTNFIHH